LLLLVRQDQAKQLSRWAQIVEELANKTERIIDDNLYFLNDDELTQFYNELLRACDHGKKN